MIRASRLIESLLCALTWNYAHGGDESTEPIKLEEVLVTAQRRQENLQDVPISGTAADAEALAAAHVDNVVRLRALSPSVNFTSNYNPASTANIQIRGIGTVGNSRAFEGAVGVFVDGAYRSRPGQILEKFLDIDGVQILRGPQGTLFGKNTSAGAVLVTSARPSTKSIGGTYEASYGNYNTGLARGALNLPISDKSAFRIAGLWSSRDGDFTNPNTDERYDGGHATALKAQLLFEPTHDFDVRIIADWVRERQNCCFASIDAIRGPTYPLVSALALARGIRSASTDPRNREQVLNVNGDTRIDDRGAVMQVNWRPSFGGELHSITSYRDWSVRQFHFDADFGPADLLNLDEDFRTQDLSQEFTFNGAVGKAPVFRSANYVLGVYYAHQKIRASRNLRWASQAQTYWDTLLAFSGVPAGTVFAAPGLWAEDEMSGKSESLGAFTHWTMLPTERFKVIAGARISREKKDGSFFNPFYRPEPNDVFTVIGVQPGPAYDTSHTDDAVSGVLGLQYNFTPIAMGYATYSRGFKAGGVNLDSNAAGLVANNPAITPGAKPLDPTYRAEFIDGYEAGLKLDYLNHRARTNFAVFYDEIDDLQIAAFLGLQYAIFSAPSAKVFGAEIENTFRLAKELTIEAAATYLPQAEFAESALLGPPLSGRRLNNAPTFAANGALTWNHRFTEDLSLVGRIAYQYQTKTFTSSASDATQGAYGLLNLNFGLQSERNGWQVELWCLNCTDKTYYTFHYLKPLQEGSEGGYLGLPLTFGVRLIGRF